MIRIALQKNDIELFRKAAEMGDGDAMCLFASSYKDGTGGYPKDTDQAMKWYRKGADSGSTLCMEIIGTLYQYGDNGLPKDISGCRWPRQGTEGRPHWWKAKGDRQLFL